MAIEVDDQNGNYVVPFFYGDPSLGETSLAFLNIDPSGTLNNVSYVLSNQPQLLLAEQSGFFKTADNGYVIANGNNGLQLLKLNENLDVQWTVAENNGSNEGYWGGHELFNNDLILAYIDFSEPYNTLSMQRFSQQGELEFEFDIELDYPFSYPYSFAVNDSLIFVSFHNLVFSEYRRNFVVCYNVFTGEEVWEFHQIEDSIDLAYTDPILCWSTSGELLYVYHEINTLSAPNNFSSGYFGRIKLAKLNPQTGQFINDEYVCETTIQIWLLDAIATDDGGVAYLWQGFSDEYPGAFAPKITKLNADLQTEWVSIYVPPDPYYNSSGGSYFLLDLEVTNDDCLVAGGVCSGPDINWELFQHPWVLKVDACGNQVVSDCTLSGLAELGESKQLAVYPNPARDRIFLKAEDAIQHATIFDMSGKIVHNESFSGALEQTLFVDHLPQGLYLVQVTTSAGVVSKRIIIGS